MLNGCQDKIWFVVELCESIKALKIEIANFELYSSVPRHFKVTMGNAYPAREKDWVFFGQFEAQDERSVQTFSISNGVFGKYARVEILSHHGTEHYCPISMFRVYGISEFELVGVEQDEDEDDDDEDVEEDSALEVVTDEPVTTPTTKGDGIVSTIIEKIIGVFRPKDQSRLDMVVALNKTSLEGSSFKYHSLCPNCDHERHRAVYFFLSSNYDTLAKTSRNPGMRAALENGICHSLGFNMTTIGRSSCVGLKKMEFYKTLFGTSRTIALCNVIAAESGLLLLAHSQAIGPETEGNNLIREKSEAAIGLDVNKEGERAEENVKETNTKKDSESHRSSDLMVDVETKLQLDTGSVSPGSTQPVDDATQESKKSVETKVDPDRPRNDLEDFTTENGQPAKNSALKDPLEPQMKDPPPVVHVTPSSTSHISASSTSEVKGSTTGGASSGGNSGSTTSGANAPGSNSNGGNQQQNQRESVWQKLSSKIKVHFFRIFSVHTLFYA